MKVHSLLVTALCALSLTPNAGAADSPGITATEIKIGQTMPYSGPASPYGVIGRQHLAYFKMINDRGGINGRRINLISLDDGYSPPKTFEQTRKLVEEDKVAMIFGNLGTPTNSSIQKYLNGKKVPQLFIASGAAKFADPDKFPWTMPLQLSYGTEVQIFAKYILDTRPNAKIAILFQNDDFGKEYRTGLREWFGDKYAKMIVAEASYEPTDATIDSQILELKASGADTLITAAQSRTAAQVIRKVFDLGWKPLHFLTYISASPEAVIKVAGAEKAVDIITTSWHKDPSDPAWKSDPGLQEWRDFMNKYMPGEIQDSNLAGTFSMDQALIQVLKQAGNDLTPDNIMKQAASLKGFTPSGFLPGIALNTSPTEYRAIKQVQMQRWNGTRWIRYGEVISAK